MSWLALTPHLLNQIWHALKPRMPQQLLACSPILMLQHKASLKEVDSALANVEFSLHVSLVELVVQILSVDVFENVCVAVAKKWHFSAKHNE